jgi:hypothetical protein
MAGILSAITATYKEFRSILVAHERLVLALLAAVLLWYGTGKIQGIIADHDQKTLTAAQVRAQAQTSKDAALAQQAAQQAAQYQALADKVTQQNAALEQANVALATALSRQQAVDKTLPPPELAQHISADANLPPQSLAVAPSGGFFLTVPGAQQLAITLDTIPALRGELENEQTEKLNIQSLLDASNGRVDTLTKSVTGLNLEIIDNQKVCQNQLKVQADKAAKRERKIAVIAAVVGAVLRAIIK